MSGFKLSLLLRSRWLWALAGTLVAIPSLVLIWLYWWVFPNLPQYKDDIAGLLSSATGYAISFDELGGDWGGARPRFTLEGVLPGALRFARRTDDVALYSVTASDWRRD